MAALLQEKTAQLKRWSGWADPAAIERYFAVKRRLVAPLPFPWRVSRQELDALVSDKLYFNQLREAVNKTREIALKYKPIYDLNPQSCSCYHTECSCCARIYVKRLSVDQRACLNFTYTTKGMVRSGNLEGNGHSFLSLSTFFTKFLKSFRSRHFRRFARFSTFSNFFALKSGLGKLPL